MKAVNINTEMIGAVATDADARKMAALLSAMGYDVNISQKANNLNEADRAEFDMDFESCMEQLG